MTADYTKLASKMQKISHIENLLSILHWDSATYMPLGSASSRAGEIATLSGIAHNLLTSNEVHDLISACKQEPSIFNNWQKANLREIEKKYIHASALNEELVIRQSVICSESEVSWRQARQNNDFASFSSHLEKVLQITKEIGQAKGEKLGLSSYDALVDQFSPGLKSDKISKVFAKLKARLPSIISAIIEKQRSDNIIPINGSFPIEKQKNLAHNIMKKMGFDFRQGRLDISTHPFCGGTPYDIRLTTRYDENDPLISLMGVIHETGHGLYEMNLPEMYKSQPVGTALGMAVHESQSLIMEMQASRTKAFCKFLSKAMMEEFVDIAALQEENLYKIITRVEPGLIRVNADEVTYPMHVILRFEIEQALISGDLQAKDLPDVWKSKMRECLGIDVPNDKDGCLQDIHWPSGAFGYFPSYTYGSMIASQLFKCATTEYPDIFKELASGDFGLLNSFLNKKLRSYGRLNDFDQTMIIATGEKLNPDIFLDYLETKYM